MREKKPKKCFIVLGMHRSATSLVARAMSTQICMGTQFLPPAPCNPRGFYEDVDIIKLNNEILRMAGGIWYDPPSEEEILRIGPRIQPKIEELLKKKFSDKLYSGWKDPRTTLTIKLFLPYLENPHFIACFRDPADVAKSLATREHMFSREKCYKLAQTYNDRLLRFLAEFSKTKL